MFPAPIPTNEQERLAALQSMRLLDTPPQAAFDRITRVATRLLRVPTSTITLIDAEREWFLSRQGMAEPEGPRSISFCGHALLAADVMVVADSLRDPRFQDNPMVIGPPRVRFYMGRPLFTVDGKRVGVFCVKDTQPRVPTPDEIRDLRDLAAWAELEINAREIRNRLIANEDERAKA